MPNSIDLHTHSTASDGIYSPTELLQGAKVAGLSVLALTDHDSTDGLPEAAQTASQLGIELISGIEINTAIPTGEVHILGYFLEYGRPAFQSILQTLRDVREQRGQRIVERLNAQGVPITWQRVREIAKGSLGRPHIAQVLMEGGYVQSISEAFDKYIGSHCPAYVPRYSLMPEDAIHLIASANGLPVMAHPFNHPGPSLLHAMLGDLRQAGLVGLETYYGEYTTDQEQQLHALADAYSLIPTGGSDFHGPGIHPTPLGGRYVPYETVDRLKQEVAKRCGQEPPAFALPPQG